MIDLHTHILPGIDDGARTLADALEIARGLAAEGITTVAATPHVRDDYPTTADAMLRAVDELRQVLDTESIELDLVSGAEVAVDWIPRLGTAELRRLTLAGGGRYLLVETPYNGWPVALVEGLIRLRSAGLVAVLAHPERNPEVQATPSLLAPLVRGGTLVQVTAASIDGRLGVRSRETGLRLIASGLAHLLASDAHTPDVRAAGMRSAVLAVPDEALAEWLASSVPEAIVRGAELPPRPGAP